MLRSVSSHASLLTLGLAFSIAGCSGDDDDTNTSASTVSANAAGSGARVSTSNVDAKTAQLALNEITGNVDATVTGFNTGPAANANPSANEGVGDGQFNLTCERGGTADASGHVNVAPLPLTVDVKLAISYQGCVTRTGTTLAGDIAFSQTAEAAGQPLRVETIYQGDVQLSGAVNAHCAVDINVLLDEAGKALEVAGSFCGQDASALELEIQPSWRAP